MPRMFRQEGHEIRGNMKPNIELKYDEERDSFYIDCGPLDNARHILNLIMYAVEKLTEAKPKKKA